MRFEFALAMRHLRSPRRGLGRITAYLAVLGIAFGVAALIFALALSRGFREEVQEKLLANTPHISISKADGGDLENVAQIKNELSSIAGVKSMTAVTYQNGLLAAEGITTYSVLRAKDDIQPEYIDECLAASVGSELASKTGLKIGDKATAIVDVDPKAEPKKVCLFVKDIFNTGLLEYDATRIDISLEALARAADVQPAALEISVSNVYGSRQISEAIQQKLGAPYKVLDWQEANKPFFAAMNFERRIVLLIISLVILLSALNITFTLALGVIQRRQDIAVMRAAGAKTRKIILTFLLEGLLLGTAGMLIGTILGLLACFLSNRFGFLTLPADVYALNKITLRPDMTEILLVAIATLLLALAASFYPALLASREKPWENLRQ